MSRNLEKAMEIFESGEYTCVLCKGETVYVSKKRGIDPMVEFLENKTDLRGFAVADKIVGKAAAMLFVLAEVKEAYAPVMSKAAFDVLSDNDCHVKYDILTDRIINRKGNDICPMEKAVVNIDNPKKAFEAIKQTLILCDSQLNL